MPRLAILNYGMGNLRSVQKALERVGADAETTSDAERARRADGLILPGVGAFPKAMQRLRELGLQALVAERLEAGAPVLGICLGLQIALDESEEDGGVAGLGLVPGRAVRIESERVPRIGWAPVEPGFGTYWFAHSYAAETDAAVGMSEGIVAVVQSGSFLGVQFHPEKSGPAGSRFLEQCLSRA
jgi:glutamine amidotransferase